MIALIFTSIFFISELFHITPVNAETVFKTCRDDLERQALRSVELQKIVNEDQSDRKPPIDWENLQELQERDEKRRKRVGEIFGEGCFKDAKDYAAAALVYQHGSIPDHFFQTFLWAKKAVELGDISQKSLMAMGMDRYLVKSGHKQLFATQASKIKANDCWCLEELEVSFPEKRRFEFTVHQSMDEVWKWVRSLNQDNPNCKITKFCRKNLKDTPKGTVPGFW